jgi:hypothetical protein
MVRKSTIDASKRSMHGAKKHLVEMSGAERTAARRNRKTVGERRRFRASRSTASAAF